jgi:hypothetical protein
MSNQRSQYPVLHLGPHITGKTLIPHLRELLAIDKKTCEDQINIKVLAALSEVINTLIMKAIEAVPNRAESVKEIAKYIGAEKVLRSALTAGSAGRARVEEIFNQARIFIDDYLENPVWDSEPKESKDAMRALSGYMASASRMILNELEEVRNIKSNIQQQNSRIKKILDALAHPLETSDLYARPIPDAKALEVWVRDVSNYYINADKAVTEVGKVFRPSYVKAWEDFINEHFPALSSRPVGEQTNHKSGRRFEERLEELLNQQLLSKSLKEFQNISLQDMQPVRQNLRFAGVKKNHQIAAPSIEMKSLGNRIEFSLRIPDHLISELDHIQSEAFLDLNEILSGQEATLSVERKLGGRAYFLVFSTSQIKDREWISQLQKLVSGITKKLS